MLDFNNTENALNIPTKLNFQPTFEPSRLDGHKFVINSQTDEVVGHVSDTFTCASHRDFFTGVWSQVTENLQPDDVEGVKFTFKDGRHNAFGMMDIQLPSVTSEIVTTNGHTTKLAQRIIALHSVDGGSGSNTTLFGNIDFFCLNGQVSGEYSTVRRKNTSNFSMDRFINQLRQSKNDFYAQSEQLKQFAQTELADSTVKRLLDSMLNTGNVNLEGRRRNVETKADKMMKLYRDEVAVRGANKFALVSAFSNYATYADDRNGFGLRNTANKNETAATSMVTRELEVNKWMSDSRFLEAA
mgnify:FL=1